MASVCTDNNERNSAWHDQALWRSALSVQTLAKHQCLATVLQNRLCVLELSDVEGLNIVQKYGCIYIGSLTESGTNLIRA